MQSIRQIERLNQAELDKCITPNASWHTDYRDTAYIYIGGLPFELSEGDVLTIFSQYGNPVHINLIRDKETGKSKGFCFLKYEDQRSCDLAVDNLSGAGVMGRVISVDHTRYKKKDGEVEGIFDEQDGGDDGDDETDREETRRRKRQRTSSHSDSDRERERAPIKEEVELAKLIKEHDEEDPMKEYMIQQKREEVAHARKALDSQGSRDRRSPQDLDRRHRHHHRSHRNRHEHRKDKSRDREQDSKRTARHSSRTRTSEDQDRRRRHEHGRSRHRSRSPE